MLLYSILVLSQFERIFFSLPPSWAGLLQKDLSAAAIGTEVLAFVPPVLFFLWVNRKNGGENKWFSAVPLRFWPFAASLALWVPIATLIVNIGVFMGMDGGGRIDPVVSAPQLNIFATCLVPAVLEEFFMRGAVLTSLRKGGRAFAVFFSSVCFAMLHGNLHNFLGPFLAGLAFAAMTVLTGSVLPAVAAHFIHNAFAYYAGGMILKVANFISMEVILAVIVLLFLLLTYLALSQYQAVLLQEEESGGPPAAENRPGWGTVLPLLSSVPIVCFFLLFLHNTGLFT